MLQSEGIESHVVDPASIVTSRRRRRAKTDRIDGETLVRALMAFKRGEPRVCSMVRAPSPEEEDRRRVSRERKMLIGERVRHVNRIKGLLFAQGVFGYEPLRRDRRERLEELRTGDGRALPVHLKAQIIRELDRLELVLEQLKTVEAERDALAAAARRGDTRPGGDAAGDEGHRPGNRRRSLVGGAVPAVRQPTGRWPPTPAWRQRLGRAARSITSKVCRKPATRGCGQRWSSSPGYGCGHQPRSALSLWFHERVERNGGRLRKTTIVALARKLLVALWRYMTAGVVIEGAVMKAAWRPILTP